MTNELPLKATLKAGTGYDAPWLTVDGATPEDLELKLNTLAEGGTLKALVNAANALKATNTVGDLQQGVTSPTPPAPVQPAFGSPQAQQPTWSAPTQAVAAAAQQPQGGAQLHPEGKACRCGNVLNFKQINRRTDGKVFKFWECPARTGAKDTAHDSEFAN